MKFEDEHWAQTFTIEQEVVSVGAECSRDVTAAELTGQAASVEGALGVCTETQHMSSLHRFHTHHCRSEF